MHTWMLETRELKTTSLGTAVRYTLRNLAPAHAFVEDPAVWLDNNPTERGLRGPVIGSRNHFGSKSARGTQMAAILYTLVETAKARGVDPIAYLVEAATRAKGRRAAPCCRPTSPRRRRRARRTEAAPPITVRFGVRTGYGGDILPIANRDSHTRFSVPAMEAGFASSMDLTLRIKDSRFGQTRIPITRNPVACGSSGPTSPTEASRALQRSRGGIDAPPSSVGAQSSSRPGVRRRRQLPEEKRAQPPTRRAHSSLRLRRAGKLLQRLRVACDLSGGPVGLPTERRIPGRYLLGGSAPPAGLQLSRVGTQTLASLMVRDHKHVPRPRSHRLSPSSSTADHP